MYWETLNDRREWVQIDSKAGLVILLEKLKRLLVLESVPVACWGKPPVRSYVLVVQLERREGDRVQRYECEPVRS